MWLVKNLRHVWQNKRITVQQYKETTSTSNPDESYMNNKGTTESIDEYANKFKQTALNYLNNCDTKKLGFEQKSHFSI